jgi:hypothetical protein
MTRLRTSNGFSEPSLITYLSTWCTPAFLSKVERHLHSVTAPLLQNGLLTLQKGIYTIPHNKWFVSDGIIVSAMM